MRNYNEELNKKNEVFEMMKCNCETKTLTGAMDKDHCRISSLIESIKFANGKSLSAEYLLFNEFKWSLEKHIFIEEKVIFTNIDTPNPEINNMVLQLVEEHNTMLNALDKIENDLQTKQVGNKQDLDNVKKLLFRHKMLEDTKFYPLLDEVLNTEEKDKMIEKIQD